MKTGHKPDEPRCTLARFIPTQMDVEDGWIERQVIEQIGEKLYRDRRPLRG